MTLGSSVANLFFSGPTNTQQEDRNRLGFADDGLPGGKQSFTDVRFGTELVESETMAPKALEEEGRPPYLHVGYSVTFPVSCLIALGHDRGWHWWNLWGSLDAFFRYSEDSPAGRSEYSFQIYDNVLVLFYHTPAGRDTARVIWRLASGFARILPRHHYIFWDLRVQQKAYD
jgi:hypothetical protein